MALSPKTYATIVRGVKIAACEAALAAITALWGFAQGHLDPSTLPLVLAVGTPIVAAAEKHITWFEDEAKAEDSSAS